MSNLDETWITSRMAKLSKWLQEAKDHVSIQYDIKEWLNAAEKDDVFF